MDGIGKWQMEVRARTEEEWSSSPRLLADARLSETRPTVFLREMEGVSKGCSMELPALSETSNHSFMESVFFVGSTDGAEPCAGSPRSVSTDVPFPGAEAGAGRDPDNATWTSR